MPDLITFIICSLFLCASLIFTDRVTHLELTILEENQIKHNSDKWYILTYPTIIFGLIAFFNFISIFFVLNDIKKLLYIVIQITIGFLAYFTISKNEIKTIVFDILALSLSMALLVILVLIR